MIRFIKYSSVAVIILVLTNFCFGQADIGFKGAGGKIGFISPEGGIGSTIGFGGVVDLGTITPDIHLGAYVEYWGKSDEELNFKSKWSQITFGAIAKYYFPMEGSKFKPYAGGGLGLVINKFSGEIPEVDTGFGGFGGEFSESSSDIGIRLAGGADFELSPGLTGFAEVVYNISDMDYFGVFVGVVKSLGK